MKLEKNQIPQVVVLGLLVLVCIGYVSFTVLKPPAVELKPPPPKQPDKSVSGMAVVRLTSQQLQPTPGFPDLSTPVARRDPFTVQPLPGSGQADNVEKQAIAAPKPEIRQVRSAAAKVPPLIPVIGPLADFSIQPAARDQDPDFVLTGVIRGYYGNVAIIRVGDSERHVVKQGQFINGRYQVLTVTSDGAVLACGSRLIHLKLGGVRNAS